MCTFCMKLSCAKTLCKKNPVNRHNCRLWGTENPYVLFEKPRVSAKLHVCFFCACFRCYWPLFFHISNREWGQLPGHAAHVRNWRLLTSQTMCSSRMEPLHTGLGMSGLIFTPLFGMPGLDREALLLGPSCLQISYLWTISSRPMSKTTAVNDIDQLKDKIQEAVRSVTADMIAASWRELRKRLVFIIEHNEAYHHCFSSCLMRWCPLNYFLGINRTFLELFLVFC